MNTVPFYRSDVPLDSNDLATCQKVLDTLCSEAKIERDSEEWRRIGVIAIQLVQQGVQEHGDLLAMVRTARGILHPDGDNEIAPYEMGSEAFIKRLDGSANPYAPDSVEAKEWEHGFLDAHRVSGLS
ncbi:hypothetical protein [Neorhizobium sp. P12A]|uniref:hypothetical protein n=1 Tax=Neorhizobium sp. P12A TaxID=2268027 RepID=UPI00165E103C|nr:hypothetical protein [Neorhizobium sp. P12A]